MTPTTPRANFLISFWYYKAINLNDWLATMPYKPQVFADCGAFSAHTQGGSVSLDEYAQWIKDNKQHFTVYPNLDVIHDPATTIRNQKYLEKEHGLNPIPVHHFGGDWRVLEAYCEKYPYIALGGMVGSKKARPDMRRWLAKAFTIAAKHDAQYHGFGQTSDHIVRDFPFYSIDSSSWLSGVRYGQIVLWDHESKRMVTANLGDPVSCYKYADLFRSHGHDPATFADRERYYYDAAIEVAAVAWVRYGAFIAERHGPLALRDNAPGDPGQHLYLANLVATQQTTAAKATVGPHLYLVPSPTDATTVAKATGPHLYLADNVQKNSKNAALKTHEMENPK
jgi:hypothetical protein